MQRIRILALVAAAVMVLAAESTSQVCEPRRATYATLEYRVASEVADTTAVLLRVECRNYSGTYTVSWWYLSFFTGDQPTLREYAEIQRAASRLRE